MDENIIPTICITVVFVILSGIMGFNFWNDYQIQMKYLEIERAKIQCQQCLEEYGRLQSPQ